MLWTGALVVSKILTKDNSPFLIVPLQMGIGTIIIYLFIISSNKEVDLKGFYSGIIFGLVAPGMAFSLFMLASTKTDAFVRTRDNYGTLTTSNLFKTLYEIENQNIANDYREFVLRYQGSFRNSKIKPLSFHNKIWFNWSSTNYDLQSSIIDGLTYNVKAAEYKIKSHVPNDDDDVSLINVTS